MLTLFFFSNAVFWLLWWRRQKFLILPRKGRKLKIIFTGRMKQSIFWVCVCNESSVLTLFFCQPCWTFWTVSSLNLYGNSLSHLVIWTCSTYTHTLCRKRFYRIKLHHQIDKLCLASLHMSSDGHRHRCWVVWRVREVAK